jgi:hypothetical protein
MGNEIALELRHKVIALTTLTTFDEFFNFVEQYENNQKAYAFCFFTFLQELRTKELIKKSLKPGSAKLFVETCIYRNVRPNIVKHMERLMNNCSSWKGH